MMVLDQGCYMSASFWYKSFEDGCSDDTDNEEHVSG